MNFSSSLAKIFISMVTLCKCEDEWKTVMCWALTRISSLTTNSFPYRTISNLIIAFNTLMVITYHPIFLIFPHSSLFLSSCGYHQFISTFSSLLFHLPGKIPFFTDPYEYYSNANILSLIRGNAVSKLTEVTIPYRSPNATPPSTLHGSYHWWFHN